MTILTYKAAYNQSEWRQQARNARFKDPVQGGLEGIRMWGKQCDILLSDLKIIAELKVSALCSTYSLSCLVMGTVALHALPLSAQRYMHRCSCDEDKQG